MVILGRCRLEKRSFGVRMETADPGHWQGTWAFAMKEETARREGYDRAEVTGSFGFAPGYPGCPFCKAPGIVRCRCDMVSCWDGETREVHCPWCGRTSRIEGTIDALRSGGDR